MNCLEHKKIIATIRETLNNLPTVVGSPWFSDHTKISVASVSPHRISEDSISITHWVSLQPGRHAWFLTLPHISHLIHQQLCLQHASSTAPPRLIHITATLISTTDLRQAPWKLKWGLYVGSSLGSTPLQVGQGKQGGAETGECGFVVTEASANPIGSARITLGCPK